MKFKEIQKLSEKDREKKMKELKTELIKSRTGTAKQGGSKQKQIRKIIARMLTLKNQIKLGIENKK